MEGGSEAKAIAFSVEFDEPTAVIASKIPKRLQENAAQKQKKSVTTEQLENENGRRETKGMLGNVLHNDNNY